jgi:hypothetical protein
MKLIDRVESVFRTRLLTAEEQEAGEIRANPRARGGRPF